ncbi:hypothetical protein [uncultured Selenomonas sp.]|uniref:hypothetical protein n=1 Tax=uncultured Selenomonas sp. TaxID=159275 RepID=UPI00262A9067|nr:hypothetical protein [uncultured Selenomonas sp.]
MITEILGALIVLGAALVFIMRRLLSKGKAKEKESVEVSANRLRYEIERSGDAVIGRMQIHVERLERILAEANAQKAALDERLAALAQWEKAYGARLGALPQQMEFAPVPPSAAAQVSPAHSPGTAARRAPAAAQRAAASVISGSSASGFAASSAAPAASVAIGTGETAPSFQEALMKQMEGGSIGRSVDLQLPPEDVEAAGAANASHGAAMARENAHRELQAHEDAASPASFAEDAPNEMEDDETYEYEDEEDGEASEEEYEESVTEEEEEYGDDESVDEEEPPEEAAGEDLTAVQEEEDVEDPSLEASPNRQQEQIRAFLRQGMSVEEISQRLGLGLGAIELVRHMEKRAHEAKDREAHEA